MKPGMVRAVIALQALVIAALAALAWQLHGGAAAPDGHASAAARGEAKVEPVAASGDHAGTPEGNANGADDEAGPGVRLGRAVQLASGVRSAPLTAARSPQLREAWGEVLAAQGLADARLRLRQAMLDAAQWEEPVARARHESDRLDELWQDGGNVARKLVDQAHADLQQAIQRQAAARSLLDAQRGAVRADWGAAVLDALEQPDGGALAGVFSGSERLLLLSDGGHAHARLKIAGDTGPAVPVRRLGAASQVAAGGNRPTWYWLGPAERLRAGQRVQLLQDAGLGSPGVLVPESAVVWQAGQSWVYLMSGEEQFRRQSVNLGGALDGGWFAAAPLAPGQVVVVQGAQLLLSEESRPLIRNENGD